MNDRRILVVEDERVSAQLLKRLLTDNDYDVTVAYNGKEALDFFKEQPFRVVITDIIMPVMDGNELITNLQKFDIPPIIFVATVTQDPDLIIDIMQKGVYSYIIKPVNPGDLLIKVKRAFEAYEMKRTIEIMEREKTLKLENQLEWYKWEERSKTQDKLNVSESLFHSLQTSFSQGAGFGAMITLVDIIASSAKKEGEHYLIDAELFDVVKKNAKVAEKALQTFADIEKLQSMDISPEKMSFGEFYDYISLIISESRIPAKIKNQSVALSEKKIADSNIYVNINAKHFGDAYREVLLNAFKYSEKNSNILVLAEVRGDSLELSTINVPIPDEEGRKGIPMEYENLVFEPFVRLTKTLSESYKSLDFGLGLAIVEIIVSKHHGKVSISNIIDHSDIKQGTLTKVNVTISLPIVIDA
ncbi:MAG: response regulator [bacterium]|nr:response regulator [bacterium]